MQLKSISFDWISFSVQTSSGVDTARNRSLVTTSSDIKWIKIVRRKHLEGHNYRSPNRYIIGIPPFFPSTDSWKERKKKERKGKKKKKEKIHIAWKTLYIHSRSFKGKAKEWLAFKSEAFRIPNEIFRELNSVLSWYSISSCDLLCFLNLESRISMLANASLVLKSN